MTAAEKREGRQDRDFNYLRLVIIQGCLKSLHKRINDIFEKGLSLRCNFQQKENCEWSYGFLIAKKNVTDNWIKWRTVPKQNSRGRQCVSCSVRVRLTNHLQREKGWFYIQKKWEVYIVSYYLTFTVYLLGVFEDKILCVCCATCNLHVGSLKRSDDDLHGWCYFPSLPGISINQRRLVYNK